MRHEGLTISPNTYSTNAMSKRRGSKVVIQRKRPVFGIHFQDVFRYLPQQKQVFPWVLSLLFSYVKRFSSLFQTVFGCRFKDLRSCRARAREAEPEWLRSWQPAEAPPDEKCWEHLEGRDEMRSGFDGVGLLHRF